MIEKRKLNQPISITDAAEYAHVSRQSIWLGIKKGRIQAQKTSRGWHTTIEAIDTYRAGKYSRDHRIPVGYLSVFYISRTFTELLKRPYPLQRVYYLLHSGQVRGYKQGGAWLVKLEDVQELFEKESGEHRDQLRFA